MRQLKQVLGKVERPQDSIRADVSSPSRYSIYLGQGGIFWSKSMIQRKKKAHSNLIRSTSEGQGDYNSTDILKIRNRYQGNDLKLRVELELANWLVCASQASQDGTTSHSNL